MDIDENFRQLYPAIAEELETPDAKKLKIDGVRNVSDPPKRPVKKQTFVPNVVDYIRRCDTVSQAVEIVDYLNNQGEITSGEARAIKRQLKSEGLRSFGTKKEKDYYLKHGLEQEDKDEEEEDQDKYPEI
ncbi:DUF2095 domain-containing protein [Candidatus Thorarchaeota archaeon]|nr:MAG: DUF2095 domain-containing protein [Candidatus Thorarchaeota archaeon]